MPECRLGDNNNNEVTRTRIKNDKLETFVKKRLTLQFTLNLLSNHKGVEKEM